MFALLLLPWFLLLVFECVQKAQATRRTGAHALSSEQWIINLICDTTAIQALLSLEA